MGTHPIFESDFDCLTEKMGAIRAIGIFLGFVATCLSFYCLITPFWATNVSNNNGIQTTNQKALGLWKYCEKPQNAGNYQCQSLSQFGIAQLAQYGIVGFRVLSSLDALLELAVLLPESLLQILSILLQQKKTKVAQQGALQACSHWRAFLILAAT